MNAFVYFRDILWLGLGQRPLTPSNLRGGVSYSDCERGGLGELVTSKDVLKCQFLPFEFGLQRLTQ